MTDDITILSIAIPSPLRPCFDYLPPPNQNPAQLTPGMRIRVPFGHRESVGVLITIKNKTDIPAHQLKQALTVLDETPLFSAKDLQFYQWASDYYHHPLGDIIGHAFPKWLRDGKTCALVESLAITNTPSAQTIPLNSAQQNIIQSINAEKNFSTHLLFGVTGSGKTEIYLQCIAKILAEGKQALVLVPEIALTPQTIARFQARFQTPIVVFHSGLTDKARAQAWLQIQRGTAMIMIGTRSAILTPFANLGMIILDEEHDTSFKQQSGFRYSARDLAVRRAQLLNIPVILGSATPSLESWHNAEKNRYRLWSLPTRTNDHTPPTVTLINIRKKTLVAGMSDILFSAIEKHINAGHQVLLFLNRRGFAPTLLCHHCGFVMFCKYCDARLTLHQKPKRLYCHHCGADRTVPTVCPECHQAELIDWGIGTERLEEALKNRYPQYQIVRMDRDSTRKKNSLQNKLQAIHDQKAQILIGTQMLAKGHHFPHLTLVAIIDADSGLLGADFRSLERMGQLLVQVAGRAGRAAYPGEILLQTHYPDHPLLKQLFTENYQQFAATLLTERKLANLPPFSYLALLRAEAVKAEAAKNFLQHMHKALAQHQTTIRLFGPIPSPMERKAGRHRYQLLVQAEQRHHLSLALKQLTAVLATHKNPRVRWSLDVDPQEMA